MKRRSILLQYVSAMILLTLFLTTARACGPVALAGREWVVAGSIKCSAQGIGGIKETKELTAAFIDASNFELTDGETGDVLWGTYEANDKGAALTIDPTSLEEYLIGVVQEILESEGVDGAVDDIGVIRSDVSAKASATSGGSSLRIKAKVRALAEIYIPPDRPLPVESMIRFAVNLKGTNQECNASGIWHGTPKAKIAIARIKGHKIDDWMMDTLKQIPTEGRLRVDFVFGPYEADFISLEEDEFVMIDPSAEVYGTYACKGNQAIFLGFDDFFDLLEDTIETALGVDASIEVTSLDGVLKVKPLKSAKLKFKARFVVRVQGAAITFLFTIRGKLNPAEHLSDEGN